MKIPDKKMPDYLKILPVLFALLLPAIVVTAQSATAHERALACQKKWNYLDLEKDVKGTVLYYEQPVVSCGVVSTASVALIKTEKGDTLRVLTLCNVKKEFKVRSEFEPGYKVYVRSGMKPPFRVDLIPVDPFVCKISDAYFGTVQFNPNQARVINN